MKYTEQQVLNDLQRKKVRFNNKEYDLSSAQLGIKSLGKLDFLKQKGYKDVTPKRTETRRKGRTK